MYDYNLTKEDISEINQNTYNPNTGELSIISYKGTIQKTLDDELITIFKNDGLEILDYSDGNIYVLFKNGLEEIIKTDLGEKVTITQMVLRKTKEAYVIRCPQCQREIENDTRLFGCLEVNMLGIGNIIVCKECLENQL